MTPADILPPGLSNTEARRRLADIGPNATPDTDVHPLRLVLGKFVAPVPCLLEAAIALQLVLGEYVEASIIAVLLVFNAALGLLREGRAQATVKALKSRLALSASVRRDGEWTIIPAAKLVPGDIVKLSLGSVVAADVRLIASPVTIIVRTRDTAAVVARAVGLEGAAYPPGPIADTVRAEEFAVFAGVLPEDKYRLVERLQNAGHVVGMCGDGVNDAPALRQAQIGIAVSTATDVAKSAAGIVLTEPGLASIVTAVREGRVTFQRILTYTLRSIVHKTRQLTFLAIGLLMTGHAILTPMLVVLSMITGDFLAMSSTTDNVRPSAQPNAWRIDSLTIAGVVIGLCDLAFCATILGVGKYQLGFDIDRLRTLTLVTLLFNGQAVFYVVRERQRLWSSWPSPIVMTSSIADLAIIPTMAVKGILMASLPIAVVLGVFAASLVLALVLDQVKVAVFSWLRMV